MPRKTFTVEQEKQIKDVWEKGLESYGTAEKLSEVAALAARSGVDIEKIKSKIASLNRAKREDDKKAAATADESTQAARPLKGCTAYTQFLGESLLGTKSHMASSVMTAANERWRREIKPNEEAQKVYKERAAEAAVEAKEVFKNSEEGKKEEINALLKQNANITDRLSDLGVHIIGYTAEASTGEFSNISSSVGKIYLQDHHPWLGNAFTRYICGPASVLKEKTADTKALRGAVQNILNNAYTAAMRVTNDTAPYTQFPYKDYFMSNCSTLTITGLPGGPLRQLSRYGDKQLQAIINNKDMIHISLEPPMSASRDEPPMEQGQMDEPSVQIPMEQDSEEQLPEQLAELMDKVASNKDEDREEYIVEGIRGEVWEDGVKKYIVKWVGYDEPTNERKRNLKDNIYFQQYMQQIHEQKKHRRGKGKKID